MEALHFLPPERQWTHEQLQQAAFCVGCLAMRPKAPRIQCAAQVDLGAYTASARLSCANIVANGGKMPEHGR